MIFLGLETAVQSGNGKGFDSGFHTAAEDDNAVWTDERTDGDTALNPRNIPLREDSTQGGRRTTLPTRSLCFKFVTLIILYKGWPIRDDWLSLQKI